MKNSSILKLSLLFVLCLTVMSSCRTKDDTIAIITVRDANNNPVANADVRVYSTGTGGVNSIDDLAQTNSSGEAFFNYNDEYQLGQAGVAILDIEVTKDAETSQGIIKIEQEATTLETVYINL
ncbi:MAG: hypothetical protein ACJAUD_001796 [Crocinitomicaceae bacterium]|jgi:hypothetical protein